MRQHTKRQQNVMSILKAEVLYFALVFGAGFVLGTIRTLWVVPRFGTRMAELMETPRSCSSLPCRFWWQEDNMAHIELHALVVAANLLWFATEDRSAMLRHFG